MQPRERLTSKEIQVASLVWQGLTNKDIAAVLETSEQVVKNHLRTTFDKLGVWTRLELALYVSGHGGASWQMQFNRPAMPSPNDWSGVSPKQSAPFTAPQAKAAASSGGSS